MPEPMEIQHQTEVQRKKRLSRKEQKARKKQRKEQEQQLVKQAPSPDTSATATASPWKAQDAQNDRLYVPTPIPGTEQHHQRFQKKEKQTGKPLGKWFPKAKVMKSQPSASEDCTILLFYQYKSPVTWSETRTQQLMRYLEAIFEARPTLGGRLRVAPEGVNATLSAGDSPDGTTGRTILEHFTKDLAQFDAIFEETDFKYIPAKADRHFKDLKILPVQELVYYGLQEQQAPLTATGVHLDPRDFHEMLHDNSQETVVIDVRNHYEAALGRFDGQEHAKSNNKSAEKIIDKKDVATATRTKPAGAKYIDPQMRKSTDWTSWLEKSAEDLKGKRVMLYCTGGVRCERASAYLNKAMGDQLNGVYQLQGGIERYMQAFPDGGAWRGRNFVFDKREAVSATDPNGDGGVLPGKKKKHVIADGCDTKCCLCGRPWDRYVGKRKCDTCGVPVLMCDTCMSKSSSRKKNKKQNVQDELALDGKKEETCEYQLARCDLCVEQGITVPVDQLEYTDNGVKSKSHSNHGKAAPSILKWGGGHASGKKERLRNQPRQRTASIDDFIG